ncbi:MAG: CPBP family intramembrane metalloprotease [Anaerolineales bacterium]|nr:CPBP family intramembrane metalloprotease [Anaerolineales bacterium]
MARKTLLLITLFVEGGLFVIGLLLMGGSDALLSRFSLSWSATGYALLLCIPMLAMLYFDERSHWLPLVRLREEINEKVVPIFANCKIIDLVVIALLAGTGEELLFRGWLQGTLIAKFGVLPGILIASAIFGLAHYLSPTYAIYAFLTGLYLGVIYQASGNLYIVMAIHAVYDFIAMVYLIRKGKGNETGVQTTG